MLTSGKHSGALLTTLSSDQLLATLLILRCGRGLSTTHQEVVGVALAGRHYGGRGCYPWTGRWPSGNISIPHEAELQ